MPFVYFSLKPACDSVEDFLCHSKHYAHFFDEYSVRECLDRGLCPYECSSVFYDLTSSLSDFPTDYYSYVLLKRSDILARSVFNMKF